MDEDKSIPESPLQSELTALRRRVAELEARDFNGHKRGEPTLHQRNHELELLNWASQAFLSTLDLDQVLANVLEEARHALAVIACSVWLIEPETGSLVCRQITGPHHELVRGWRLTPGQGIAGWVAQTGQSLNISDTWLDQRYYPLIDRQIGLDSRSILAVPLLGKTGIHGVLEVVDSAVGRFDETDLHLIELLAAVAAGAIENARLYESLKVSQAYAQNIINSSLDMIITVDLNRRIVEFNRAAEQTFGYCREDVIGQSVDLLYADPVKAYNIHQLTLARGQHIQEIWNRRRGGELFLSLLSASVLQDSQGELVGVMGVSRDITQHKQIETELHSRNRELSLLNQLITASAEGRPVETILELACRELALTFELPGAAALLLNEAAVTIEVAAEYQANGRATLLNQVIPIADPAAVARLRQAKAPIIVADAASHPDLGWLKPLLDRNGTVSLLILPLLVQGQAVGGLGLGAPKKRAFTPAEVDLAWDVVNQVAGALVRSRLVQHLRRLGAAVEQTDDSITIADVDGTILYVNPAFERISGYHRDEMIGQPVRRLKSGQHAPAYYDDLTATLRAGQAWRGQLINRKQNGSLYTTETTLTPVRDENGVIIAYVSVQRDITRQLELEAQLRQAQKMEAIGQLAGGIAHDFNNILTAIMGYAGMALTALPPEQPGSQDIQDILTSARRAASLIRQLLTFARRQVSQPRVLNLNELVLNLTSLLRRLIGAHIELVIMPGANLGRVRIDPHQIEQVLLNLVINARDAMPGGGILTITTTIVRIGEQTPPDPPLNLPAGNYICLRLSDTGAGIAPEIRPHIFEPFFTTKEAGQGTGLGLAICLGIIRQHNGDIQVSSNLGQGTTFTIYLPQVQATLDETWPDKVSDMFPRGRETILLVEDEPPVRELAGRALRQLGYTVLEAANGMEALRQVKSHGDRPIHLLLTDLVMPLLGGWELAMQLRQSRPNLRVLFTSGYTDQIIQPGREAGVVGYLPKPFTLSGLAYQVRELLDN